MGQEAWIKAAQAVVMLLAAFGIQVTEADMTSIVTGAFGLLSVLSCIKAWMSRSKNGKIEPTRSDVVERANLDLIAAQINTEEAKKKAYESKVT